MGSFNVTFKIHKAQNCPLYEQDDTLDLTDKALAPPAGKPVCLILAREITELLFSLLSQGIGPKTAEKIFSCSGCTGLIKFKLDEESLQTSSEALSALLAVKAQNISLPPQFLDQLKDLKIFQALEHENLIKIISHFQYREYEPDVAIYTQGDHSDKVSIILAGTVEVIDGDITIATLGKGDILGEMSQLTGHPVSATVKSVSPVKMLTITGENLKKVMIRFPALYMYFLRLLTERLIKTNAGRVLDMTTAMTGTLAELPPVELLQLLHLNHKTGVLRFDFPRGSGTVAFREGSLIGVNFDGVTGQEALYRILAEKDNGRFSFNAELSPQEMAAPTIGEFMGILMESVRRVDEADSPEYG